MTGGLHDQNLVVVAARPGLGKTSFCLNVACHAAINGRRPVGIFSLEMSKEQLFLRLLSGEAGIDGQRLRTGFLHTDDWDKLTQALAVLGDARIYIDDTPGVGVLEMRAKSRRLQQEKALDLLIVDYIQLMQGRGRFDNRTQELGSISRSLKGLAKELNVPIVVLSQLSRAPESRSDHRPQLSDLRESGSIEQDSDIVMFIYRESVYKRDLELDRRHLAEIHIAKHRNGPVGTVELIFRHNLAKLAKPTYFIFWVKPDQLKKLT